MSCEFTSSLSPGGAFDARPARFRVSHLGRSYHGAMPVAPEQGLGGRDFRIDGGDANRQVRSQWVAGPGAPPQDQPPTVRGSSRRSLISGRKRPGRMQVRSCFGGRRASIQARRSAARQRAPCGQRQSGHPRSQGRRAIVEIVTGTGGCPARQPGRSSILPKRSPSRLLCGVLRPRHRLARDEGSPCHSRTFKPNVFGTSSFRGDRLTHCNLS
jgi:hypothetical protein